MIAAIGLCHSFVFDPIQLKATNQEAFTDQRDLQGLETQDNSGVPNVIKSDHYNPLVNMRYKEIQISAWQPSWIPRWLTRLSADTICKQENGFLDPVNVGVDTKIMNVCCL